jgi:hypothetical protein
MSRVAAAFCLFLIGCPTPAPSMPEAGIDAGLVDASPDDSGGIDAGLVDASPDDSGTDGEDPVQTVRLRIVNGCETDSMWFFYLVGSGGGSLDGTVPNQVLVAPGNHYDYPIPEIGIAATRFWPGFDCDATGNNCRIGQSGGPSSEGFTCPPGVPPISCAPPIDSKFEGTFGCLPSVDPASCQNNPSASPPAPLPSSDSWDTSMVDGFTLPYRVRVLDECSGGPMGGEIDCSTLPMSACPTSVDLSSGGMFPEYASLSLVATNPSDAMPGGCFSDCGRMTYSQWGTTPGLLPSDPAAQAYCCPTPPVSPETCRTGPVASSEYVNLVHRTCPQVYAYSYDDGTGLWGCPAGTRYEVTFYCPE